MPTTRKSTTILNLAAKTTKQIKKSFFPTYSDGPTHSRVVGMCLRMLEEDVSMVSVEMASGKFVEHRRSASVSFFEKMATFGTLGSLLHLRICCS